MQSKMVMMHLHFVLVIFITAHGGFSRGASEYCIYEQLEITCDIGEAILLTSAKFGRMNTGRCIANEYDENLGCFADVLDHLDQRCSGRRSCSMQVSELVAVSDPCPKDLTPYLEADFLCIKGLTTLGISNIIEAQQNKNRVEITFIGQSSSDYLLKLEVIDSICDEPSIPQDGWMTRTWNTATIGCDLSDEQWELNCVGSTWMGRIGSCPLREVEEQTDEIGCPDLELPSVYTRNLISSKLLVTCETTEEITLLVCEGDEWKQKYPSFTSIYLPFCF